MDLGSLLQVSIPSWEAVAILFIFFFYLAIAGSVLPGRIIPGVILSDRTRLQYCCNGLLCLLVLIALLVIGVKMNYISPTAISDRGLELLSATFWFSVLATFLLCVAAYNSSNQSSSLKPRTTGTNSILVIFFCICIMSLVLLRNITSCLYILLRNQLNAMARPKL